MLRETKLFCPECEDGLDSLPRRDFLRAVGGRTLGAVALGSLAGIPSLMRAEETAAKTSAKPAEGLVRELHASLSEEQRKELVLPWDHGSEKGLPTRLGMYNRAIGKRIADAYTKPQRELLERILRSICSDENGYERISRNGTFDTSGSLDGCGATIFGDPSDGKKFSWVFAGHHLTVRCDGNSEPGAAFGGPMYYGHSPNGYSDKNVFYYQTQSMVSVFDALSAGQRKMAIVAGGPGEQAGSVKLRPATAARPGIGCADLTADQRALVEQVMRDLLSPYRKEDADEAMQILKDTGGMEKLSLAFYRDNAMDDNERWHYCRFEGPGFVWNYRTLPHVHCFVNIVKPV